jgi:hypothetical protein
MGVKIVGINYKDEPDAAKAILAQFNDPYSVNLLDQDGKLGIDLGVYGAPESFIVDANGVMLLTLSKTWAWKWLRLLLMVGAWRLNLVCSKFNFR